ncbi:MAG: RimK/LysX family protein [Akkermansiaceae bacterium]|jgi:hypothetical protein|nr:RimK/LysX family protein [Akkermansiaceae bacterium]MDP4645938.1 RimK/LysX family protein [Akkermansiaceae bacterium]MDP4722412.1 RimK/LysX family protein [Akkermansiaceae bacterium]MDP4781147.1 RimK/LysX family protein [Akkermansiaceae bacterium]MDP4846495.1 RimK/LysX family protein [Akkermansiaceae bacterium]
MSAGKLFKSQFQLVAILMLLGFAPGLAKEEDSKVTPPEAEKKEAPAKAEDDKTEEPKAEKEDGEEKKPEIDPDDEVAVEEADSEAAAVARPVSADPIQIYGWREKVLIDGVENEITAKLDTGAYTSSIHAEDHELFERDGKKWVRFIVTEPRKKGSPRVRVEAPLVRIARIKEPGGESESREVVRLAFKIGDRKLRGDFTLNDRSNMLSAILIGRVTIRELGWIDPSRVFLADDKIMR